MIGNLTREQFATILHQNVRPTSPIQSQEHLFGREKQLQQVKHALYAPGRTVFIYGDRGVGKTSLAQTVAYSYQSAAHDPILLACVPDSTFESIMWAAIAKMFEPPKAKTIGYKIKADFKLVGFEVGRERTDEPSAQGAQQPGLNEIINALVSIAEARQTETIVIVVDEFDRISSNEEKGKFADFIKQLGDQLVPIRFVFCGVADSLNTLLGAHGSCYRYLEGVELRTLNWEPRFEIIDNVAKALGVKIIDRPRFRIAAISDGFPHYIHRMCEQLFWQMYEDPLPCVTPTYDHYRNAVALSVVGIEQHLKVAYEQAIDKDVPGYEDVLWAVADHSDMIRTIESIYTSYQNIFSDISGEDETVLDRQTVVSRLNGLKGKSCGAILVSERRARYKFRESIMRGYVRLRAEEQGCELALDYAAASRPNSELTWRPRPARKGKFGTSPKDRSKSDIPT